MVDLIIAYVMNENDMDFSNGREDNITFDELIEDVYDREIVKTSIEKIREGNNIFFGVYSPQGSSFKEVIAVFNRNNVPLVIIREGYIPDSNFNSLEIVKLIDSYDVLYKEDYSVIIMNNRISEDALNYIHDNEYSIKSLEKFINTIENKDTLV